MTRNVESTKLTIGSTPKGQYDKDWLYCYRMSKTIGTEKPLPPMKFTSPIYIVRDEKKKSFHQLGQ